MAHRQMGHCERRAAQDEHTQQCPQGCRQTPRGISRHTVHLSRCSSSLRSRSTSLRSSWADSWTNSSLALSALRRARRSVALRRSGDPEAAGGAAAFSVRFSARSGGLGAAASAARPGPSACRCGAASSSSALPPRSGTGSSLDRLPRSSGPTATQPRQGWLMRHHVWPSPQRRTSATSTAEPLASTSTGCSTSAMPVGRSKTAYALLAVEARTYQPGLRSMGPRLSNPLHGDAGAA
mmetsp:Transcript_6429/g.17347  ORF Transcript_6429/g.17347 Transcript_6429/m.17347 type:complete len:237 (-) Transcript_6429:15-725(-)